MTKKIYEEEAVKLAKAADIAIEALEKYPPEQFTKAMLTHVVNCYREWKNDALNPEPKFKKIASLKYVVENVFTYFQESDGKGVDYFWEQIRDQNLGYVRQDKLWKIIKRGKIRNRIELEYVMDLVVAAEQEQRIATEAKKLAEMIGEFESGKR